MREISKDKNVKDVNDKKTTSSSTIRDLKIQEKYMSNKEDSISKRVDYLRDKTVGFFSKSEKFAI